MKRYVIISSLECSRCGQIFPLPRKGSRRRKGGHIKGLWCFRCKKITDHVERAPKKYK